MAHAAASRADGPRPSKALHIGLWILQWLLGITLVGTGLWKLATPVTQLAAVFPWMGQVSEGFLRATAVVDLCGGLGLVLPALTRIKPGLTALAALGCVLLQASAIVFHISRGEAANTPFNFFLVGLALFIFWGRSRAAPIAPRA